MSVDTSDLDSLSRDFGRIPGEMVPKIRGVVSKAALNTKKNMRRDARGSRHFEKIAPTIDYDLRERGDVIEAEVGPKPGGAGSLAGIAYFGTSKPGGGTVRDPTSVMLDEAPSFFEFAFKATEGLL